eukprot:15363-Heterococcus_DN1.PRE.2
MFTTAQTVEQSAQTWKHTARADRSTTTSIHNSIHNLGITAYHCKCRPIPSALHTVTPVERVCGNVLYALLLLLSLHHYAASAFDLQRHDAKICAL